jgi:hypothetical protein
LGKAIGKLGRIPAALLLAGGLMIGGGIGGFVLAGSATVAQVAPTPHLSITAAAASSLATPMHHCTHGGGSGDASPTTYPTV